MIYKRVIRPVLLYGTESAELRREEERRLEVGEMRLLRNTCRISFFLYIQYENLQNITKTIQTTLQHLFVNDTAGSNTICLPRGHYRKHKYTEK